MLSTSCIQKVRDVEISRIIAHFITIKKKGANYAASCPFHNEKSDSFVINDQKGIYKCFGCGKSGDAINFVMEHENKLFIEACEIIANISGIEIERVKIEQTEKQKEIATAADLQERVLNLTIPFYKKLLIELDDNHPAKLWLKERKFTEDIINKWEIGWAGSDWSLITPKIINKNLFDAGLKLGIIKRSKDGENNYDGYRNRIIFPIKDKNGKNIGLGGRYIKIDENETIDPPKYINPSDCELYNKSAVLYGLNLSTRAIKEKGFAIITEGYMDVITPHTAGFDNTIGTCGTAFTAQQMQLIKKYTNQLAIMRDNDDAGKNSFRKYLPDLLKLGFKVQYVEYEGKDPDECFSSEKNELTFVDAIIYRVNEMWTESEDLHKRAEAKADILKLLANIENEFLRSNYLDNFSKAFKWKASETKKQFNSFIQDVIPIEEASENAIVRPDWANDDMWDSFEKYGFTPVNRKVNGKPMIGYYSFTQNGKSEITNFLITPLFHVYAGVESRFLLQLYNGVRKAVLDIPAKVITSIDQFQAYAVSESNYIIFGAKAQWLRIASELLQTFPRCIEIGSLGWQSYGFYAWVNKIFIPGEGIKDLDNWGIIKHGDENFLIPASCEAYRQLQRTGDDPYENDRYLTYKEGTLNFEKWSLQMENVYKQQGVIAVAYCILTIFRDIVFDVDNNCPHLYGFGEPSSGKSKWAESMTAIFYSIRRSAFNLNSGTDFAFFNYMQRYNNSLAHLNEFDIDVIKQEWFQAIKGIYDGEGRERGKGGSKNRTEVMKVRSTLILTGQKLVTADDNSVVTRSIIESFSTNDDRTEEDKKNYDLLKDWETKGMSNLILEILLHREYFVTNYKTLFNEQLNKWRREYSEVKQINQRILQNYSHLSTCYSIISNFINLPKSAEHFTSYCFKQANKWSQFIRNSDTLSEFWRTLEFLYNQQDVIQDWDYIIEEVISLKVRENRTKEVDVSFDKPTKVIFIRLNNIHKLFQQVVRTRTGKSAMEIENLLFYFSSRKYYVGPVKMKTFKRFITTTENVTSNGIGGIPHNSVVTNKKEQINRSSCYAFIYADLGIEIENFDGNENINDNIPLDNGELPF